MRDPNSFIVGLRTQDHKSARNLTLVAADRISLPCPHGGFGKISYRSPLKMAPVCLLRRWSGCGKKLFLSTPVVPAGRFGLMDLIRRALGKMFYPYPSTAKPPSQLFLGAIQTKEEGEISPFPLHVRC